MSLGSVADLAFFFVESRRGEKAIDEDGAMRTMPGARNTEIEKFPKLDSLKQPTLLYRISTGASHRHHRRVT